MSSQECINCGAILDKNQRKCKYCDSNNPYFTAKPTPTNHSHSHSSQEPQLKKSNFNIVVFILLLIFFWPGAIIYAVVSSTKK